MLVIKDFATTTLASALPVSATTMTVSDVSRLPVLASGDYFYLVLQKFVDRNYVEIVKVVEIDGDVLTINRAQDGTTIKSFAAGDYAELRLTSKGFSEYISQNYNQTLHDHNHDFTAHPELAAALDVRVSKAESSATAAMMSAKVYSTVALGLAETPVGQYFSVLSGNVNQYVNLYLNNAGAAKLEKTYPTDKALDDWQRMYPGLFLHNPYYEDSGAGLYFKPTSYGGNYIYIRGGYLADASFTYDKFKADLAVSIPADCAIGVTSPFGATDCIKLAPFTTLWYDPATQTFSWGARAKKNYFIKFLEYNSSSVARCEEYPVIVDAKHGQNAVKANSKIPCQIIPSMSTAPYIPNIDTAAKTLTFYADTILEFGWTRYVVAATTAVDLSIGTSAVVVYFDRTTSTFVAKAWNYTLTEVEKYNFVLVAALRLGASIAFTSVSISCPYLVDGKRGAAEPPSTQPVAQIYTPLYGATSVDPKLPNFDTSTSVFTLYRDTILQSRDMEWVLPADVNFTVNTSSTAVRVWWNTVTNTLESNSWSANQSAQQLQERVLVTTIRNTAGRATLSINCPYTVNGRLFDALDASDTALPNPLDANVRCIMHRGFSGAAPENTLPAFKKAAEFFNYYIESDIQWTSDNVPVMLHDSTIDRTSDGSGAIGAMTLAQVKTYDFGSWYSPAYAGTKIPTFEETMRCMKNLGLHGYMEIKSSGITTEQIHILQNILHKTGMMGRIIYISFSYTALQNMVALYPNQDVAYLGAMSSALIARAVALKTGSNKVAVDASWDSITAAFVEEAHVNGLDVVAWTVNSSATAVNLGNMGVDGITTDSLNIAQVLRTSELG